MRKHINRFARNHGHRPLVLITGGSSGMGLEYARQLAACGCPVALVSNQEGQLAQCKADLEKEFGVEVFTRCIDLATDTAPDEVAAFCKEFQLDIDIFIANAGMYFFQELTPELEGRAQAMLRLHITTNVRLCMLFGEQFKRKGYGHILLVSSMTAKLPMPGITVYAATKAFLKSFGCSYHIEMRNHGVGVTTVCPGAIATPLYNISPKILELGIKSGFIKTPKWLVRKALRGMFRGRKKVVPGAMNYYLPFLLSLLPTSVICRIWKRLVEKGC